MTLTDLMENYPTEKCQQVKRLVKVNKMHVITGQQIDFELPFPKEISKEMYYELISKVLSDLRQAVNQKVDLFYSQNVPEKATRVMTVEHRDQILMSVNTVQIRETVLKEFGVNLNGISALDAMKHAFFTYAGDSVFKNKVTDIKQQHDNKLLQVLKTR